MRYLFDRDSNSLVITLAEGRKYRDSEEVTEGVVIDFDVDGRPYAIELLQAGKLIEVDDLVTGRPIRLTPRASAETIEVSPAGLKRWREQLAFSHAELASRLELPSGTIAAWESGERPIENMGVLRLALQAIEGNAHEEYLRQALRDVTEALQQYLKNESSPLKLASGGRAK
jgi:DNA-binding transcriptional regulator YiaG